MKRTVVKNVDCTECNSQKIYMLVENEVSYKRKKTNLFKYVAILLVFVAINSCSPWKEAAYIDKGIDFSQYKSLVYYGWSKGSGSLISDSERTNIEKSFGAEFRKRGIEIRTFGNEADLVVSLFMVLDRKTTQEAYNSHYGDGIYSSQPGFGSGFGIGFSGTTYKEYDYVEGTLIVDVIDAKTKKLIWQGIGKGFVDSNPVTREKNIPGSVANIMKPYPVKPVD